MSDTAWVTYPAASIWGHWLILLYDLALLERNMAEEVPGLRYMRILRDGENVTIAVETGSRRSEQVIPLDTHPAGIPIDLAHDMMRADAEPDDPE